MYGLGKTIRVCVCGLTAGDENCQLNEKYIGVSVFHQLKHNSIEFSGHV